jgi:hypothetical protein
LSKLVGQTNPTPPRAAPQTLTISRAGKVAATLTADTKGRAVVRFEADALPESRRKALMKLIEDFLQD